MERILSASPVKIAVFGAGFSGLALCYHLLRSGGCQVTLFDAKGVGGGASGVATGLLHPYTGEQGKRSWHATEGLCATHELLKVAEEALQRPVANYGGIMRLMQNEAQSKTFSAHIPSYGDLSFVGPGTFLIHSGITVYSQLYLQGLFQACRALGAVLYPVKIDRLELLEEYDQIVVAAGVGTLSFPELGVLPVAGVRGQVLTCALPERHAPLERSLLGKGHMAVGPDPLHCQLGSTYERGSLSEEVDEERARKEILPKVTLLFPDAAKLKILECRAGVRVSRKGHYLPFVKRVSPKVWVLTGMGSRGLLYHAYFAKTLSVYLTATTDF